MTTVIQTGLVNGRHRCVVRAGLIRPQICYSGPDRCRVGLVATRALLLGGDEVELQVQVGPGSALELFDVAATVAYDGRGRQASWVVGLSVGDGASVLWRGEPLVISDGATVQRRLRADLGNAATAVIRDTVVFGRFRQDGGDLHAITEIAVSSRDVLLEDQLLTRSERIRTGVLGDNRVMDTVTCVGGPAPAPGDPGTSGSAVAFQLIAGAGSVTRFLGSDSTASPLHDVWEQLQQGFRQPQAS